MGLRAVSPIPDVSSSRRAFARSSFVYRKRSPVPLQPRQYHLQHRDRECPVEIADLGHISDQPLLAAEQLRGEHDLAGVGYRPEDRLHECRFPASVGAYYSQEIILCDREVDIFQRLVPVVRYADVV